MMQTADARRRLQFRAIWFRLHGPPGWCVLFKPEMSPVLMVVSDELAAQPPDVRFIERYHMIEALSGLRYQPIVPRRHFARDSGCSFAQGQWRKT